MPLSQDIAEMTRHARTQEGGEYVMALVYTRLSAVIRTNTWTCTCAREREYGLHDGRQGFYSQQQLRHQSRVFQGLDQRICVLARGIATINYEQEM